jgi:hypothetical protein
METHLPAVWTCNQGMYKKLMSEPLQEVYQHDPNIVARSIAGETILVPIRKNVGDMENIFTLNETAARIWELIDGQRSLREIHQRVVEEFEVDPQQAESDLLELVESLNANGALTLRRDGS